MTGKGQEPLFAWLVGLAKLGKTTFAVDMARSVGLTVVVPMDQRFQPYENAVASEGLQIAYVSDNPSDWASAKIVTTKLKEAMPGSGVKGLVWDTISPGFEEANNRGQELAAMSKDERAKVTGSANKASSWGPKALYMKEVAEMALFGANCLWISHLEEGGDKNGQDQVRPVITDTELNKFARNLNLRLLATIHNGRYAIQVIEARERPALNGMIFVDEVGMYRGMWNRIREAYFAAEKVEWKEQSTDADDTAAISNAMEITVDGPNGPICAFTHPNHARNAYTQIKAKTDEWLTNDERGKLLVAQCANPEQVAAIKVQVLAKMWRADIDRRLKERLAEALAEVIPQEEPEPFVQPTNPVELPDLAF